MVFIVAYCGDNLCHSNAKYHWNEDDFIDSQYIYGHKKRKAFAFLYGDAVLYYYLGFLLFEAVCRSAGRFFVDRDLWLCIDFDNYHVFLENKRPYHGACRLAGHYRCFGA